MRITTILALTLFALPLAFAGESSDPCVPDGATKDVTFDLPDAGDLGTHGPDGQHGPSNGGPAFEWLGNHDGKPAKALESDPISSDDPMGNGLVDPENQTVSVPVKNDDGDLSGPNGDVQNGVGEGDCIEVYMTVTYRVWEPSTEIVSFKLDPFGIGGGFSMTRTHWGWHYYQYTTVERDVCPC